MGSQARVSRYRPRQRRLPVPQQHARASWYSQGIASMRNILRAVDSPVAWSAIARPRAMALGQYAVFVTAAMYSGMADAAAQTGLGTIFATQGKDQGAVRPPRPPYQPGETYRRLAGAISHVGALATPPSIAGRCHVGILSGNVAPDPNPKFPLGTPLEVIDAGVNGPTRVLSYDETVRSRAYAIMMREGRGGFGTRKPDTGHLPDALAVPSSTITVVRTGKPIWETAARSIQSLLKQSEGLGGPTSVVATLVRQAAMKRP